MAPHITPHTVVSPYCMHGAVFVQVRAPIGGAQYPAQRGNGNPWGVALRVEQEVCGCWGTVCRGCVCAGLLREITAHVRGGVCTCCRVCGGTPVRDAVWADRRVYGVTGLRGYCMQ